MGTPVYHNTEAISKPIPLIFLVSLHPIGLFLCEFDSDITCFYPQLCSHAVRVFNTGKNNTLLSIFVRSRLVFKDPFLFLDDPFLEYTQQF